jgi:hypothetical protein
MYSDCCGAYSEMPEIDLCPECLEHCEFIDDDEEEEYDADIEDLQNY